MVNRHEIAELYKLGIKLCSLLNFANLVRLTGTQLYRSASVLHIYRRMDKRTVA